MHFTDVRHPFESLLSHFKMNRLLCIVLLLSPFIYALPQSPSRASGSRGSPSQAADEASTPGNQLTNLFNRLDLQNAPQRPRRVRRSRSLSPDRQINSDEEGERGRSLSPVRQQDQTPDDQIVPAFDNPLGEAHTPIRNNNNENAERDGESPLLARNLLGDYSPEPISTPDNRESNRRSQRSPSSSGSRRSSRRLRRN